MTTLGLGGCVSDGQATVTDAPLVQDGAPASVSEPAEAGSGVAGASPTDPGAKMTLGPLADEDLRRVVWKAMESRVARTHKLDNGAEETVELGDFDSFRFTVTKTLNGADDISGDQTQPADGMEVEATGWYKKSLSQSEVETKMTCISFDAPVLMARRGGAWMVPDAYQVTFAREDQEDCY